MNNMIDIERRNKAIRKCFYEQLGKGRPIMEAYAMAGQCFYLSERRVREIIAEKRNKWRKSTTKKGFL